MSKQRPHHAVTVRSPLSGTVVSLNSVPDPKFAMGAFGAGIAVIPDPGVEVVDVKAPFTAVVRRTLPHLYILEAEDRRFLMQLGVDTARLEGQGFACHVQEGDAVTAGSTLCTYVPRELGRMGFDPSVLLVAVQSTEDELSYQCFSGEPCDLGSPLFFA